MTSVSETDRIAVETFVPSTVRQARWFIVGGVLASVLGVVRLVGFLNHGGLVYLVMGTLFLVIGAISVIAAVSRIRRGDDAGDDRT
ncbi:MAG: hypothetical protein U1C73_18285 [Dietzia sp.]|nr:hypothetical protein [Dietzia sp.]